MKMTRTLFALPLLLLFSSPGDAADLSFLQPSACGKVTTAQSGPTAQVPLVFASSAAAYCEADCGGGTIISCSGMSCSAQDRACPESQGHVTCDGQTYTCGTCEPGCNPGDWRQEPEGCCTPYKGKFRWYLCNGSGQWEWTEYYMCEGACRPAPVE